MKLIEDFCIILEKNDLFESLCILMRITKFMMRNLFMIVNEI